MLSKKSNLPEPPRKPREARWPEDAGRVKNLDVGDVLVVDGKRYGRRYAFQEWSPAEGQEEPAREELK